MKIYHGDFSEVPFPKILEPIDELMAWKYVDQICFHTEKSLEYLKFIKSEEVFL